LLEAALKQVDIKDEQELDEYSVEIDILSICRHRNIVGIYEAYYFNSKLCV
jgi:STE20-like kinase